jgi:hypothetical protein
LRDLRSLIIAMPAGEVSSLRSLALTAAAGSGWSFTDWPVNREIDPTRTHLAYGPFNSEVQRIGLLSYTKIFFI